MSIAFIMTLMFQAFFIGRGMIFSMPKSLENKELHSLPTMCPLARQELPCTYLGTYDRTDLAGRKAPTLEITTYLTTWFSQC